MRLELGIVFYLVMGYFLPAALSLFRPWRTNKEFRELFMGPCSIKLFLCRVYIGPMITFAMMCASLSDMFARAYERRRRP